MVRVLLSTCSAGDADGLAHTLLEERLVACVNVVPGLRSHYWWEGKVTTDDEVLLVIKTHPDRLEALLPRLAEAHPYDVPEILVLPVETGHAPYLAWIAAEASGDQG